MRKKIDEKVTKFFAKSNPQEFKKGIVIIAPEDNSKNIYYINSGHVRMYSISESGKELTLNIFKPGTYFPGAWAIAKIPNLFFYEAMTDVNLSQRASDIFVKFIEKEPEIMWDLSKRVITGLNSILIQMDYLLSSNAYTRVAAALLFCTARFGKVNSNGETEIQLALTHKDIANLAGLTREATSRQLKKMSKEGLITNKSKRFIVKNVEILRENSRLYYDNKVLPYTF